MKRGELSIGGKLVHRLLLPDRAVAVDIVEDLWGENKEAAVDVAAISHRLLFEFLHELPFELERTEASRRTDGGDGREPAVLTMKREEARMVN